jgi:putative phosphoesterase
MIIAIISDIHGNYHALKAVIADLSAAKADAVIFLGDILFFGDEPQKCFETVKSLNPLVWIRGNTDDWLNEIDESFSPKNEIEERCFKEFMRINPMLSPEAREKVRSLPEKTEIDIEGKKLLCVHGSDTRINGAVGIMTPKEELKAMASRLGADMLLCGHTHTPFSASVSGKLIINVGSVGKPDDEPRACYLILRFEGNNFGYEIRRVKY